MVASRVRLSLRIARRIRRAGSAPANGAITMRISTAWTTAGTLLVSVSLSAGRPVQTGELPPDDYLAGPGIETPCGTTDWVFSSVRYAVVQTFVFDHDEVVREDLDGDTITNQWNGNTDHDCQTVKTFSLKRKLGPAKYTRVDKTLVTKSTTFGFEVGGTIHNAVSAKISFGKIWSGSQETAETYEVDMSSEITVPPCWQANWHGFKKTHYASGYLPISDEVDYKANCFGGTVHYIHAVEKQRYDGSGEKLVEKFGTVEWTNVGGCRMPALCE